MRIYVINLLFPVVVAGLASAHALSTNNENPQTASRPFDKTRDGFVFGEGGGAVLLETETHAKKRGAQIKARLLGFANSTDGYHVTAVEMASAPEEHAVLTVRLGPRHPFAIALWKK